MVEPTAGPGRSAAHRHIYEPSTGYASTGFDAGTTGYATTGTTGSVPPPPYGTVPPEGTSVPPTTPAGWDDPLTPGTGQQ